MEGATLKQFRLKIDSRLGPEALIDQVAQTLDDLMTLQPKEAWRVDQRAERFMVISRAIVPGRIRRMFRFAESIATRTGRMQMTFLGGMAHRAHMAIPAPDALRVRHDFLSAQAYPKSRGSELNLKGTGRQARQLAEELMRRTEAGGSVVSPATLPFD